MSGEPNPNGTGMPESEPSPPESRGRSLPPPAFPPGVRRVVTRRSGSTPADLAAAMISPDDPIPDRDEGSYDEGAFISPDEPIPQREPRVAAVAEEDGEFDPEEGVVTGMGLDAHMDPEELALGFDPHVLEVVEKVGKLAESLKRKGEAGLRTAPDMSRFDVILRSYCVGYLAGRRAEEEEG